MRFESPPLRTTRSRVARAPGGALAFSRQPLEVNGRKTGKFAAMHRLAMRRKRQLTERATRHERLMRDVLTCLNVRFQFQYACLCRGTGVRVVDFKLPDLNVYLEVDGDSHDGRAAEDLARERQVLAGNPSYKFVRFTNRELETSTSVALLVWQRLRQSRPEGCFDRWLGDPLGPLFRFDPVGGLATTTVAGGLGNQPELRRAPRQSK